MSVDAGARPTSTKGEYNHHFETLAKSLVALQFPAEKAWPGDEFVDYVGVDVYGGLDNPDFIARMHGFISAPGNALAFHSYFDVQAPDGHHQLSPGLSKDEPTEFPMSAQSFKALFGKPN